MVTSFLDFFQLEPLTFLLLRFKTAWTTVEGSRKNIRKMVQLITDLPRARVRDALSAPHGVRRVFLTPMGIVLVTSSGIFSNSYFEPMLRIGCSSPSSFVARIAEVPYGAFKRS